MFRIRFSQVFSAIMALSLISAFAAPPRLGSAARVRFDALLAPVSEPSYLLTNWARRRFSKSASPDTRPDEAIIAENLALKAQVAQLQEIGQKYQQFSEEQKSLGNLKSFCDRFRVTGTDGDDRDGLILTGSGLSRVQPDDAVITGGNPVIELMGRVTDTSALSAHVRLITDVGFVVTGRFVTFSATYGEQEIPDVLPIVRGDGRGRMSITNIPMSDAKNVNPGDWVVLSDPSWPEAMQRVRIGRVASRNVLAKQALFAEIQLVTDASLIHAPDVWVMNHPQ